MKLKEYKEMLAKIPDDTELCFEVHRESGEIIYATPAMVDDDYTIVMSEDKIMLSDVISEIESKYCYKIYSKDSGEFLKTVHYDYELDEYREHPDIYTIKYVRLDMGD